MKTADSRKIYEERIATLLKFSEMGDVTDKTKRERIKKILDYTISSIIREKIDEAGNPDAVYREIKAYIELVRDMVLNLPAFPKNEQVF